MNNKIQGYFAPLRADLYFEGVRDVYHRTSAGESKTYETPVYHSDAVGADAAILLKLSIPSQSIPGLFIWAIS